VIEIRQTEAFASWFRDLRDRRARARVQVRIDRLSLGNPGDAKPVGEGVSELRIDYGPGYRVYFVQRRDVDRVAGRRRQKHPGAGHRRRAEARAIPVGEIMSQTKTVPWNTEDHLETPEDIAAYLEAVFEDGDPELIGHALGAVARAKGMTEIARRTGLGRQSLYKALSPEGRPEFETVLKVVQALGLKLTVTAA
jgi:probable addiction module antidote protein/putative addiction module killer protein